MKLGGTALEFSSKYWSVKGIYEVPNIADDIPTFMGIPYARSKEDLQGADAAIIGIPYERAPTAGRPRTSWAGWKEAPNDVRRSSLRYGGYLPELDIDILDQLRVVDYGNVAIVDDVSECFKNVMSKVSDVLDAGCVPITLGGLSGCASYAVIRAFASKCEGKVGVVSLDAHADNLDREYGPKGTQEPSSATWQARMWDDCPNVDPRKHVEIGQRGPRMVREQVENYLKRGCHFYPWYKVRELGVDTVCEEMIKHAFNGVDRVWMHFDMDVIDMGTNPDWGDEPLGLSVWEVVKIAHEAGRAGLGGLSFVAIPPGSPAVGAIVTYVIDWMLAGRILGGHKRTVPR